MLEAAPPRYPAPEWFGLGSEEKKMSTIALSRKAAKLMKLCDLEGLKLEDLLQASVAGQRLSCHLHDGGLRLHD